MGGHSQPKHDWQEPDDLARYERDREEPDNFRHRMLANLAAFAFTVALTAVGIWLAMSIADLRRTQDCVLMGRHDCVRISVAAHLSFQARSACLALKSDSSQPASIELGASLRYTGTRLWPADRAFRGSALAFRAVPGFIFNISKA